MKVSEGDNKPKKDIFVQVIFQLFKVLQQHVMNQSHLYLCSVFLNFLLVDIPAHKPQAVYGSPATWVAKSLLLPDAQC